jgi:hypothetical protein
MIREQELIAGLLAERLEISHRARIGCDNLKDLTLRHVVQGFLGSQDWQRTIQSARIKLAIKSDFDFGVHL